MTDNTATASPLVKQNRAPLEPIDVTYPTSQYDRERAQHMFTMMIGVILVVSAIGIATFSGLMFKDDEPWAGAVLVLFAATCLVLGLGAAVPDGRTFFLKVFTQFRGGMRELASSGNEEPGTPAADTDDGDQAALESNDSDSGQGQVLEAEHRPAGPDDGAVPNPDDEIPADRQLTAEREATSPEAHTIEQAADNDQQPDVKLSGWGRRKVRLEERWRLANRGEMRLRNHIGPTYLLDETYHFLDWNPVFDELIAREIKLHRGMHAQFLVNALSNRDVVIPRSQKRFPENAPPLVDLEPLVFDSKRFGRIEFQKIASRVLDEKGDTLLWVVTLNISAVEEKSAPDLWKAVRDELVEAANWTAYAASYDRLLTNFDDYQALVDMTASRVGDAIRCIDLGAGTGNTALKLLQEHPDRLVWAVEENDGMLSCLDNKVDEIVRHGGEELSDRLFISKANISSLGEFQRGFFDAATMTNVLYAVDNPVDCLKEVNRILRTDGVLVLSTSTNETDVDKLFDAMRANLEEKSLFEGLRTNWVDARTVHARMDAKIHRDTRADIRAYLEQTGFAIDEADWVEHAYVDAVVVAKAVKVREAF